MFKIFSRSLAFRLGLSVVIIETLFMIGIGLVYFNNFAYQIDERQKERLAIASDLIVNNKINLSSLVDHDVMSALVGDEITDAMLIDTEGIVAFSLDPAYRRVPVSTIPFVPTLNFEADAIIYDDFVREGTPYLASMQPVKVAIGVEAKYVLYIREQVSQAEVEKREVALQLATGFSLTVVMTSLAIYLFFRMDILGRLDELVQVFRVVEGGDLSARSKLKIRAGGLEDEISLLQNGTNTMIARLETLVNSLEQRVADRTRDLTISAQISHKVTTILNQAELLTEMVEQTKSAFGFYQVSIFEYIPSTEELHLVAASGDIGNWMKQEHKTFALSDRGLVPTAGMTKKIQISNNILTDPNHRPNVYLPNTHSEATVPIVFGGELIGVLDLQSEEANRFVESDVELFSAFANQLATAFRNARLFEEVEQARQKAELADKAKSAFLASTSHELRTPLNAIINLTSFVKRGIVGPIQPRQEEILSLVMQSGQNLLALINDVLDMSKIESGSLKLYFEDEVDLHPIIDTTCATAQSLLQDKPVKIITQIPDNLPTLKADKHRVEQILLNILSNACKFTDVGEIIIHAEIVDNAIQIAVRDTGAGIAPEDMKYVFEKFAQTESGLRQGGGTGLGMPITKNLVEAHGGQIWLESQVGVGTVFYFTLPIQTVVMTNHIEKESIQ